MLWLAGGVVLGVVAWEALSRPKRCAACAREVTEANPATQLSGAPVWVAELARAGAKIGTETLQHGMVRVLRQTAEGWEPVGVVRAWAGVAPAIDVTP